MVFTRHIPPTDSGIMFYKNLLKNQKPNQIIKVVVKINKTTTELMTLKAFIEWVEGYMDEEQDGEVLDI